MFKAGYSFIPEQYMFPSEKNGGPFEWDLMASEANVMKTLQGQKLMFFSRYFDQSASAKGADLFAQSMNWVATAYCLPPLPMIGMVLNYLKHWSKDRLCRNHSYH